MNCEGQDCGVADGADVELSLADRWIIGRLQETITAVDKGVAAYRFDLVSQALYEFIWNEYCDWYLELSKPVLWDDQAPDAAKRGTRRTLVTVLEAFLRLLHPLMPFITEEIWQTAAPLAGKSGDTIMLQPLPHADVALVDHAANGDIEWLKAVIVGIRNIRGEMNVPPGREIPVYLRNGDSTDEARLAQNSQYLKKLAKLERIEWLRAGDEAPVAATALAGDLEILVPMAGLIDTSAEVARLEKEIGKLASDIDRLRGKLDNESFISKAPEAVVAKEREKLESQQQALTTLQEQLERIGKL